ncbi:uncharacterized protein LOC128224749 [Mya arenaria]|nr:uncharacterized protein LOC128224749 [Mya arenaria]
MNRYNIESTIQALSETGNTKEDQTKKTFFILVGVTVAEALIISVIIYVSLVTKNKYKRKLKASNIKPLDHVQLEQLEEKTAAIPGSNMYAKTYNPLLNAKIDSKKISGDIDSDSGQSDDVDMDDNEVGEAVDRDTVYDRMEEKEATMDLYNDDTRHAVSSEDLLGATLQLHAQNKSVESLDRLDADSTFETLDSRDAFAYINETYEDMESTEI